jgi:hypothetical protein
VARRTATTSGAARSAVAGSRVRPWPAATSASIDPYWVPTPDAEDPDALPGFDGIWVVPGSRSGRPRAVDPVPGHLRRLPARIAELLGEQFFLATLFQPELAGDTAQPHPIIRAFAAAVVDHARQPSRMPA